MAPAPKERRFLPMDTTLAVLCGGLVLFAAITIGIVVAIPKDGQLYTLFAGVFGQFSGALMMHLRSESKPKDPQ